MKDKTKNLYKEEIKNNNTTVELIDIVNLEEENVDNINRVKDTNKINDKNINIDITKKNETRNNLI